MTLDESLRLDDRDAYKITILGHDYVITGHELDNLAVTPTQFTRIATRIREAVEADAAAQAAAAPATPSVAPKALSIKPPKA